MIINKLNPQGYCSGVKNALKIVYDVLNDPRYPRPIFLLGSIIHNKNVIQDLEKKGAILIEEKGTPRSTLIEKIDSGTVIISAHGVSPIVYEKAKKKGLTIVDTTCGNVLLIQKRIKDYISKGYTCLYIGTKGHPECEGILGISSSILLIEHKENIPHLSIQSDKIYVTNQTTLSLYETEIYYKEIEKYFPKAILDNSICKATTVRQEACMKQEPVDLCLVVGDKSSSNTQKLCDACETIGIKTRLIETKQDLEKINFEGITSISITSGASTPDWIVDEIIDKIKRVD